MISKILTWYLMLKKRLLKKTGFMVILFMIPIFAFVFYLCSQDGEKGLLRIALSVENEEDELAVEMMEKVKGESKVFHFITCDTEEEAKTMVEAMKADAAWVFTEEMEAKLEAVGKGKTETLVKIYESEENTFLKVSREKIFSVLYPYIAYYLYEDYVTSKMLPYRDLNQSLLEEKYEIVDEQDNFIEFVFLNSEQVNVEDADYLTSSIRGLLMCIMLLAGIAATMFFLKEEEQGIYSWMPMKKRIFVSWGNNIAALSLAGVFVTIAFVLGGNYTFFLRETVAMILFILMAAAFCSLLGIVFRTVKRLSIALPTVLVASIVFCPVFFNINMPLQQILPPYFYLYSINDGRVLIWMVLYCVILYPLGYLLF